MLQFHPFWMISIKLKAKFRRATRGIDENAVAHRLSIVLDDSLRGIVAFRKNRRFSEKSTSSEEKSSFFDKICVFQESFFKEKSLLFKENHRFPMKNRRFH